MLLFIIFGTRGVRFKVAEGQFECPQCATTRHYKHKKVRRFFTLYFIPIIPLDSLGEYVECQSCKGTFVTRILEYNKTQSANEFQSEYEKAIRHTMALMVLADGIIEKSELEVSLQIVNKFSHNDWTMAELEAYVAKVQQNPESVSTYLKRISGSLNEHGKETVLKCALSVAASDGHVHETEIALAYEMAEVMDMSKAHVKGIIAEVLPNQPILN